MSKRNRKDKIFFGDNDYIKKKSHVNENILDKTYNNEIETNKTDGKIAGKNESDTNKTDGSKTYRNETYENGTGGNETDNNLKNNCDEHTTYSFIRENVLDNNHKKSVIKKILFVIVMAIIFGAVSGATFLLFVSKSDEAKKEILKEDNDTETQKNTMETTEKDTNALDKKIETAKPVDDVVKEAIDKHSGEDSYDVLYKRLSNVGKTAEKYMASVIVKDKEVEWFDEENMIYTSGIVIKNETGAFVLVNNMKNIDDKEIHVVLENGKKFKVHKQISTENYGLMLLSIELDEKEIDGLSAAKYSEKENEKGNDIVIMGNLKGVNRYISYGRIITENNKIKIADAQMISFTTNIKDKEIKNGFVIDMDGNVIGMIIDKFCNKSSDEKLAYVSFIDISQVVDLLMSGNEIPYIGILGEEVTEEVVQEIDEDMPLGIYVTSTEIDSPAYKAGVMNGDILVEMNGVAIKTFKEYMEQVRSLDIGKEVNLKFMRKGKMDYKEINYSFNISTN